MPQGTDGMQMWCLFGALSVHPEKEEEASVRDSQLWEKHISATDALYLSEKHALPSTGLNQATTFGLDPKG